MKKKIIGILVVTLLLPTVLSVPVIANEPPNPPFITGSPSGTAGEEYQYTFVLADPEGNSMMLAIDWGDGTIVHYSVYYANGAVIKWNHVYDEKGIYLIQARAKDTHDAESQWGTFQVSMPKSKTINSQGLFENGNIGFMLVTGDFTETETQYAGHFSFMLFIGFVDEEFTFYTVHDEMMVLEKSLIRREILITSKIIIAIVAE